MKIRDLIPPLLLIAASFAGYGDLLDIGWVGQDSITAVESSRFHSLDGFFRLFERSLMQDTGFIFTYYRPVTALSFGFNHLICGAGAFGYHLVDLLILAGISLLIYTAGLCMPRRPGRPLYLRLTAFGAALLFVFHTVNLTVLPVVARRSEGLLVLFGFAALVCTLLAGRRGGLIRVLCFGLAGLFLALSTLSKEAGLLFFPPVLALAAFGLRGRSFKKNLALFAAAALAAGLLGIGLMQIRHGVIQVPATHNIHLNLESACKTAWDYILTLFYPVRFLGNASPATGRFIPVLAAGASVLLLGGVLLGVTVRGARRAAAAPVMAAGALAGAIFLVLLFRDAAAIPYDGSAGPEALWTGNALSTGQTLIGGCIVLGGLTCIAGTRRLFARGKGAAPSDMAVACAAWLFCAWVIVSITGLYTFRNSMGPSVAVLLLLLLLLDWAVDVFRSSSLPILRATALAAGGALLLWAATLMVFGYPVKRYSEWHDLDRIATPYLEGVIDAARVDGLEGIREIGLEGVPGRCFFKDRYEKSVALAPFVEYTMQSWFRLRLPEAPPVRLVNRRQLKDPSAEVKIVSRREGDLLIISAMFVRQGGGSPR